MANKMKPDGPTIRKLNLPILPSPAYQENGKWVIDIEKYTSGQVEVIVPSYKPRVVGDKIAVYFKAKEEGQDVRRYLWVDNSTIGDPQGDPIFFQPLEVFKNGDYLLSYSVTDLSGNEGDSPPLSVTIINAVSEIMNIIYHQTRFYGNHLPGVIDSWLVPADYSLSQNDIGLVRTLATGTTSGTIIEINRQKGGQGNVDSVAQLKYDGTNWQFSPVTWQNFNLSKGDTLTLNLTGSSQFLALELTI